MSVRKDKKTGHHYFRCRVRYADGTRKQIYGTPGVPGPFHDLPNTKIGAMEAEKRAIAAVVIGKPLVVAVRATQEVSEHKSKTIREHSETFLATYKPESKPATKRDRRLSFHGSLLAHFGDMTIEALKQTDLDRYVAAELKRGSSTKLINNRLGYLSCMIKYVDAKPSARLRFHIDGKCAEVHAVDPEDVERLLGACKDDRHRVVILLAYEAGLRAGEIRGLQWTDVKSGQLTVRRALDKETGAIIAPKHNKTRTVPLSPRVAAALAALPKCAMWVVPHVDGGPLGYYVLRRAMNVVYKRAQVTRPQWPMHCLRHSFGTEMAKKVPLPVLQKLMGHAEVTTTMRYVDVSEDDKRDAIAAVFGCAVAVQSGGN